MPSDVPEPEEEVDIGLSAEVVPERDRGAAASGARGGRAAVRACDGVQEPHTLDQVVERLGISRNRVRRLEANALARLAVLREVQALRRFA